MVQLSMTQEDEINAALCSRTASTWLISTMNNNNKHVGTQPLLNSSWMSHRVHIMK